jgi:hypothetical protein
LVTVNHLAELVCDGVGALRNNCNRRRRSNVLLELIFFYFMRKDYGSIIGNAAVEA